MFFLGQKSVSWLKYFLYNNEENNYYIKENFMPALKLEDKTFGYWKVLKKDEDGSKAHK